MKTNQYKNNRNIVINGNIFDIIRKNSSKTFYFTTNKIFK